MFEVFDGLKLRVLDANAPLPLAGGERKLKLRMFVDRSVLEVFANDNRVCHENDSTARIKQ